jgi:hypothetical protein
MSKTSYSESSNSLTSRTNRRGLARGRLSGSEISVLLPDNEGKHDIGHVKAIKAPEGVITGATTGGVTGGVLGLLAGVGALAIPGVGLFIAAGPIAARLAARPSERPPAECRRLDRARNPRDRSQTLRR